MVLPRSPLSQRNFPRLTDRYRLGTLPIGISPICIGLVGDPRVVPEAYDAGINFFFVTADMHWPIYEKLRRGLQLLFERGLREEVVVGVVSYVAQPEFCHTPFDEVISTITGLKRIDLRIAGGASFQDLLGRLAEYRATSRENASSAIGASFHHRQAALFALNHNLVDIGFLRYNPLHRGAEEDLFPHLHPQGPALRYNFKSTVGFLEKDALASIGLSEEHWHPSPTDYYRYALSNPHLDGILCALNDVSHVRALADAMSEGPLSEGQRDYLNDLAELSLGKATLSPPDEQLP